jgi:hypothetical protein
MRFLPLPPAVTLFPADDDRVTAILAQRWRERWRPAAEQKSLYTFCEGPHTVKRPVEMARWTAGFLVLLFGCAGTVGLSEFAWPRGGSNRQGGPPPRHFGDPDARLHGPSPFERILGAPAVRRRFCGMAGGETAQLGVEKPCLSNCGRNCCMPLRLRGAGSSEDVDTMRDDVDPSDDEGVHPRRGTVLPAR